MREFLLELYAEHLEEASFLHGQCRYLRRDDETPWPAVAATEARLEAHIDALVLGGELAIEVCGQALEEGDAGVWHAVSAVFTRHRRAPDLTGLLTNVPLNKPLHLQALADALCQEVPVSWQASLLQALRTGAVANPVLLALAWRRRWVAAAEVAVTVPRLPGAAWPWCQTWLASVPDRNAVTALPAGWMQTPADDTPWASPHWVAIALARLAPMHLATTDMAQFGSPVLAALAGGRQTAQALVRRLLADGPTAPQAPLLCEALGALGDLTAVRPLLSALADGGLAPHAAVGLYLITGAPLFEQVFVPDDDDAAVESPLRPGSGLPRRSDGRTFGIMRRKLVQDTGQWSQWLDANAAAFRPGLRHRLGQPASALGLLAALRDADYPKAWRGLIAIELSIRYRVDLPFDMDLNVAQQQHLLGQAATLLQQAAGTPGQWLREGAETEAAPHDAAP
jgi:hypothetical protein